MALSKGNKTKELEQVVKVVKETISTL